MQTVTLEVPEAQLIRWVRQLSPAAKRSVLRALSPGSTLPKPWWTTASNAGATLRRDG